MCFIGSPGGTEEPAPLPGPGLDFPVDIDGDGVSTYGDRYAFNYWLELGGDLASSLSAAEAGKVGVIDLSKFFSSSAAVLKPGSAVEEAGTLGELPAAGGGSPLTESCATSASIVAPFGAPTTPASLFVSCRSAFGYPTGADIDRWQGLWCSRGPSGGQNGVVLLDLSQSPPMGQNGTLPLGSPGITGITGFPAEDIAARESPTISSCPGGGSASSIHAMSTWPGGTGNVICYTFRSSEIATGICGVCGVVYTPEPFAIDAVRAGMPGDFGLPEDIIFSDREAGVERIRRAVTPGITPPPPTCYDLPPATFSTLATLDVSIAKVWGLALGDFKGTGVFAAYFVAQPPSGPRTVRRLVKQQDGSYSVQFFASLTGLGSNSARSLAFDPISGDLFVSEDEALSQSGGDQARIWRISKTGTVRLFGKRFNKPNGIAFHPSGVMLVAEESSAEPTEGNVLAVGGWRNLFKRGDANGDGTVDISDPIFISNWIHQGGPVPRCLDGADANDDSWVNDADRDFIFNFLFSGGPPPPSPGPYTPGRDPTGDLLDCITSQCSGCPIN